MIRYDVMCEHENVHECISEFGVIVVAFDANVVVFVVFVAVHVKRVNGNTTSAFFFSFANKQFQCAHSITIFTNENG